MEKKPEQIKLTEGDYVIYNGLKLCRFDGMSKKKFDGIHEDTYYKLTPEDAGSSTYYVSKDKIHDKIRNLISKKEVIEIIDSMPDVEPVWYENNNERKNFFQSLLKSNDYHSLIQVIRSVYVHSRHQSMIGKKTSAIDEAAMKTAEDVMYQEFGHVLGLTVSQVRDFILNRLEGEQSI